MADLRQLLVEAADNLPVVTPPPFENVLAQSRRRRIAFFASWASVAAAATTCVAVAVPLLLTASRDGAAPLVSGGTCRGVAVVAEVNGTTQRVVPLPGVSRITIPINKTLTLTASGPCAKYVRFDGQGTDALAGRRTDPRSSPHGWMTSYLAVLPGTESLVVSIVTPCETGVACNPAGPIVANIAVTVPPLG